MNQFIVGEQFPGTRDQKGYVFKVLDRSGATCLLEKHNPTHKSGKRFWEVVTLKNIPERRFSDGRVIEPHLAMPSPEEWGLYAWSYDTLGDALSALGG